MDKPFFSADGSEQARLLWATRLAERSLNREPFPGELETLGRVPWEEAIAWANAKVAPLQKEVADLKRMAFQWQAAAMELLEENKQLKKQIDVLCERSLVEIREENRRLKSRIAKLEGALESLVSAWDRTGERKSSALFRYALEKARDAIKTEEV